MPSSRALHVNLALAGLVFSLLLAGSGCNTSLPYYPLGAWEKVGLFYAKADSDAKTFLSRDLQEASVAKYTADSSLTGGAIRTVGRVQGSAPGAPTKFDTRGPVGEEMFLNLSKPITGVVWVSDTFVAASDRTQQLVVRVEAYVGETRLGGQEFLWQGSAATTEFMPFYFHFRPETPVIEKSDIVSFRVTRISGGLDFVIGTDGAYQSMLEVHYYSFDPLGSTVSVKNRQLIVNTPGGSSAAYWAGFDQLEREGVFGRPEPSIYFVDAAPADEASSLVVVAALPLLATAARRRSGRTLLLAAVLMAGAFAGCLGADKTKTSSTGGGEEPSTTPTISARYEENKTLEDLGAGAVQGIVRDENNITVNQAHIALLGTAFSATTNKLGLFNFPKVGAGTYMVRVDADGFQPLEKSITVLRGKITHLNVTIVHPVDFEANKKLHRHDDWGPDLVKASPEVQFSLFTSSADYSKATGRWVQPYYLATDAPISTDLSTIILPGTRLVEVKFTWTDGPAELGLRVTTAGNFSADQRFVPRKSGDVFNIPIFPNEADPGHQKFTSWTFNAFANSNRDTYNAQDQALYSGGKINMVIRVFKGIVPFEPEHKDFWGEKTELPLNFGTVTWSIDGDCNLPVSNYVWNPQWGTMIPPGTKEVRGVMKWTPYNSNGVSLPNLVEWGLLYKPANVPLSDWSKGLKPATKVAAVAGGLGIEFKLEPLGTEVDQFYQYTSNWAFYADDRDPGIDEQHGTPCVQGYGTKMELKDLRAIRDPAWRDI